MKNIKMSAFHIADVRQFLHIKHGNLFFAVFHNADVKKSLRIKCGHFARPDVQAHPGLAPVPGKLTHINTYPINR